MYPSSHIPIRVLLIDSHQIVLWGLEKLINSESPRMEIAGKATNGADARRLARESRPDIVLLDLDLGGEKGVDLIPDLLRERHFHIIIFTEIHDQTAIDVALFNGARGVVYKKEPTQTILKAIQKVHDGELWLDRRTTGRVFINFLRAGQKTPVDPVTGKIIALTRKERMIVNAFANEAGASNKKIARTLDISEQTLRNHLTSIFSKLEITNRFDLFMFAKLHHHQFSVTCARSESPASRL
ncbi:LuxR family two component transcriptional regulator [Nitrosospira sp. Nsp5]|uniref:Two component transcriptional regulator, LuxR family n=1 Tax=Nitrosospira multiformis TaxID=1231 RepID=A0ABY0T7R4_9PROT|nr:MULTISPECIES: response regulator transcription factor [Nitrosospira]PTR07467.1 LuxR family two component transcriptional regulator [Nitrosospira sp. Nsp5]SDQ40328.1 two component transcriptional regulator, LuxR family [Nitrosospira multiformis]